MEANEMVRAFLTEAGRKGGTTTKKKHGKEHYKKMSRLGVEARKAKQQL